MAPGRRATRHFARCAGSTRGLMSPCNAALGIRQTWRLKHTQLVPRSLRDGPAARHGLFSSSSIIAQAASAAYPRADAFRRLPSGAEHLTFCSSNYGERQSRRYNSQDRGLTDCPQVPGPLGVRRRAGGPVRRVHGAGRHGKGIHCGAGHRRVLATRSVTGPCPQLSCSPESAPDLRPQPVAST